MSEVELATSARCTGAAWCSNAGVSADRRRTSLGGRRAGDPRFRSLGHARNLTFERNVEVVHDFGISRAFSETHAYTTFLLPRCYHVYERASRIKTHVE